jgi:hypothetical protein
MSVPRYNKLLATPEMKCSPIFTFIVDFNHKVMFMRAIHFGLSIALASANDFANGRQHDQVSAGARAARVCLYLHGRTAA